MPVERSVLDTWIEKKEMLSLSSQKALSDWQLKKSEIFWSMQAQTAHGTGKDFRVTHCRNLWKSLRPFP